MARTPRHLTPKEIELLHKVWLEPSERLACEEIHHHDIVHFALAELERQIASVLDDEVFNLPRDHLRAIRDYPLAPKSADSQN